LLENTAVNPHSDRVFDFSPTNYRQVSNLLQTTQTNGLVFSSFSIRLSISTCRRGKLC